MTLPQQPMPRKRRPWPLYIWFAAVATIAIVVIVGTATSEQGSDDQSATAAVMCEEFVRDRLKSPVSAQFSDVLTSKQGSLFTVSGSVDAQNGFGAMIRNRYRCEVTDEGNGTWRPINIALTGR